MIWERYNQVHSALRLNGKFIADIYKIDDAWNCWIKLLSFSEEFQLYGVYESIDEVELEITAYIYGKCNQITDELCKIRDALPSIHKQLMVGR